MPEAKNKPESVDSSSSRPAENQIVKELFFPTPVFFVDLKDSAELNQFLKTRIYAWRDSDNHGIQRSNVRSQGSWHSVTSMNQRPEFELFVAKINAAVSHVYKDQLYSQQHQASCLNMWANINPRNGYNRSHTHPGSLWSGVYYVQAPPDSGRVVFQDPRAQAQVILANTEDKAKTGPEQWSEVYHQAIEGRLILFPAWLRHEVEPNLNTYSSPRCDRISISFNYSQAPVQQA